MRRAGAATAWILGAMCLTAHTSWAADSLSVTLAVGPGPGEVDLNIGAHTTCLDDHFHGTLDAVGFWKRTLSEGESILLWNHGDGIEYPV